MHRSRARATFQFAMSTRSDPHWQNSRTGTAAKSSRKGEDTANVSPETSPPVNRRPLGTPQGNILLNTYKQVCETDPPPIPPLACG